MGDLYSSLLTILRTSFHTYKAKAYDLENTYGPGFTFVPIFMRRSIVDMLLMFVIIRNQLRVCHLTVEMLPIIRDFHWIVVFVPLPIN